MQHQIVPPRLAVLLARHSADAIVICRHKSRRTAIIGWDRRTDTFEVTQWLKGKLYPGRSDLSPDGRHWIYFAMSEKGRTYTVVAKTPYLKALDFYSKKDAWNGGGLFLSNTRYWLNDGGWPHQMEQQASGLAVRYLWEGEKEPQQGEDPLIYFRRLERDRWVDKGYTSVDRWNGYQTFCKKVNETYDLIKVFHAGSDYPIGKSPYYETHLLYNRETEEAVECRDWQWADTDRERLLWAEHGCIFAAEIYRNSLGEARKLFDAAPLEFRLRKAPY